jgi:hypothetical protein
VIDARPTGEERVAACPEISAQYPEGGFAVPAGGLAFGVVVFSCLAAACLLALYYRRLTYGASCMGPNWAGRLLQTQTARRLGIPQALRKLHVRCKEYKSPLLMCGVPTTALMPERPLVFIRNRLSSTRFSVVKRFTTQSVAISVRWPVMMSFLAAPSAPSAPRPRRKGGN